MKDEAKSPSVELAVAAAGPLMSLAIGGACAFFYYAMGNLLPPQSRSLLFYFFIINLALVVFNLLPGFPLDGGRILRAVLWGVLSDLHRATALAVTSGKIFAGLMVFIGSVNLLMPGVLPWYLEGLGSIWLIVIGLFLWSAAAPVISRWNSAACWKA